MDFLRKIFEGKEEQRKYALFIIFLIGLIIIWLIPNFMTNEGEEDAEPLLKLQDAPGAKNSYEKDIEDRLTYILSKIKGVGEVDVMVTTSKGAEIVVSKNLEQTNNVINETDGNNGVRKTEQETVKSSTQVLGQNEKPLVLTELQPEVSGVLVVCQGANDVIVKDAIIRSVSALLNVPSYKVEVLAKN